MFATVSFVLNKDITAVNVHLKIASVVYTFSKYPFNLSFFDEYISVNFEAIFF